MLLTCAAARSFIGAALVLLSHAALSFSAAGAQPAHADASGPVLLADDEDTVGPRGVSAGTSRDGSEIIVTFNEALQSTPAPNHGLGVEVNGEYASLASAAYVVQGRTVTARLYTPVTVGQTVTVSISGADEEENPIRDVAGNPARPTRRPHLAADNNVSHVTLVLTPDSILENGGSSTITARLDEASSEDMTVTVSVAPVAPATSGDVTLSDNRDLSIAAGSLTSTGSVHITANDNDQAAPARRFTVSATVDAGEDGYSVPPADRTLVVDDDDSGGICARTGGVREAILARVEVTGCAQVTDAHLAKISGTLELRSRNITSLRAGDFAGLSSVRTLSLYETALTSLPAGLLAGLSNLQNLYLDNNSLTALPADLLDPVPELMEVYARKNALTRFPTGFFVGKKSEIGEIQVYENPGDPDIKHLDPVRKHKGNPLGVYFSLQPLGQGRFKIVVPVGTAFKTAVSLNTVNGTLANDRIVIPAGRSESDVLTVTRTPGTNAPVTVGIADVRATITDTRPGDYSKKLTSDFHNGIVPARTGTLPVEVLLAQKPRVQIMPRDSTDTVTEGTAAAFTLTRESPHDSTLTVSVNVVQTGDVIKSTDEYEVPTTVEFLSGEGTATLTVETQADSLDEQDGTITATVTAAESDPYVTGDPATADVTVADDDEALTTLNTPSVTQVPADWSLLPSGLTPGDRFRLLVITSTKRHAKVNAIRFYNNHVQKAVAGGHADIRDHSSEFHVLGCTSTVDALTNTGTGYTSSDKGVAVYWLGGDKVADDYADLYDGSWDSNEPRDESGDVSSSTKVFTGCSSDGTTGDQLGDKRGVDIGRPRNNGKEINDGGTHTKSYLLRPLFGLSPVFEVGPAPPAPPPVSVATTRVPADWSLLPSGLSPGDRFRLLVITSTKRHAKVNAIRFYNNHVQKAMAGGHADIRDHGSEFHVLGCTSSVDALTNTGTGYTSSDKGVAVYWLGGDKVADDYADLYDGSWDSNEPRDESGDVSSSTKVFTGCNRDGTTGDQLGDKRGVDIGRPRNNGKEINDGGTHTKSYLLRPLFGLSPVFEVGPADQPEETPDPLAATGLSASNATRSSVDLAWTLPDQPDSVTVTDIQVQREADGSWSTVATLAADATSHTVTGLTADTSYRFCIRIATDKGDADSEVVAATTQAPDPDATRSGAVSLGAQSPANGRQNFKGYSLDRAGGDEIDYFTFTTDGHYELGLGARDQTVELAVTLENASGTTVGTAGPPADPDKDQVYIEWLKQVIVPGTYYVRVQALGDGATDYYIRLGLAAVPAVSVADASAEEGTDATADFAVTLSPAPGAAVTVRYATSNGTALAGEDYTETSGTLNFAAGDTSKTVSVPVLDDAHDEGQETFTLTLLSASGAGAYLADATATGTIENADPMPQAWLARFGRAASDNVVQAIRRRWDGGSMGGGEAHITIGGRRIDTMFDRFSEPADAGTDSGTAPGNSAAPATALDEETRRVLMDLDRIRGRPAGDDHVGGNPVDGPSAGQSTFSGHNTIAGSPDLRQALNILAGAAGDARWARIYRDGAGLANGATRFGLRDLLMNSSFYYSPAEAEGYAPARTGWLGEWALWGEGAATHFRGADGQLNLDGDVTTALVGFDSRRGRWLTGLALAYTDGTGAYTHQQANVGAMNSTLTSLHPYAHWQLNERTGIWSLLGYGTGALSLTPQGAGSIETDLSHSLAAFGGRAALTARSGQAGRFELALRSDAQFTETESDAVQGLVGATGATSRLRLMLEGSGSLLVAGKVLTPTLESGLRYDGGDAETGAGLEVGGGLAYAAGALQVALNARALVMHQDTEYREWGYSASISYAPSADGRGLSMNLGSTWGVAESGVQSLWDQQDASGFVPGGASMQAPPHLQARLGYGVHGHNCRTLWVPYIGTGGASSTGGVHAGLKLTGGENLDIGLELGHGRSSGAPRSSPAAPSMRLNLARYW